MSFFPGVPAQKWLPIILAGVGAERDGKGKRERGCGMEIQAGLERGQMKGMELDGICRTTGRASAPVNYQPFGILPLTAQFCACANRVSLGA